MILQLSMQRKMSSSILYLYHKLYETYFLHFLHNIIPTSYKLFLFNNDRITLRILFSSKYMVIRYRIFFLVLLVKI